MRGALRDSQARSVETPRQEPVAERRLVSVLFADLVGFTTASEGRDAEDTRELLTRYFDTARTIVERYGGTVEKFIGDAVMALWGAPVAHEDDAERAVRAALELVEAMPGLHPALRARAGVLTGEAAITLGATDQGMVAGDLVNTASRIQSAAQPGTVLVGDATRRASEAAIDYGDEGAHELKGKAEPVPLFRAHRVIANRGGQGRGGPLEAPFVGRSPELRLLKDLFHASADESRARLVSVVGVAGIGKSRLAWEFEKYIDGLIGDVWWHRGRCLSYGDGVAFWALAEMVRGRARIVEDEPQQSATNKVIAMLELHVEDAEERAWIELRLLHLLGLTDRTAPDREDLFAAWRRFFERLAEQGPLVLILEDLHWADEGLVSFVEYLLDWSRKHPIFVVTLSRPEVGDRHPRFPGTTRNATTLPLEPLRDDEMDELLSGLVPDLPDDVRARLRVAADGIPLYAVETVRMLRDRGLLTADGAGDLSELEVPETLHALIASRLDALPDGERRLLQDGAVLGKTFTTRGLAALSGARERELEPLVADLVRKELLAVESDPFSPELGQLGFLQALVQRVTYETIARRDRRARHLAAARFLAEDAGIDADEIAEVIAAHYLDAHQANPEAADADDVRAQARAWFTRAAERAASLAASLEAQRAFSRVAELSDDAVERGKALTRAGQLAFAAGRVEEAESLLSEAIDTIGARDRPASAAAENALGEILFATERLDEAIKLLEKALRTYESEGGEAAVATVSTQLARFCLFAGRQPEALVHVERGLELAEKLELSDVLVQALNNKGIALRGRPIESLALMRESLRLAEETDDFPGAIRACMNLSYLLSIGGREHEALAVCEHGLELARTRGDRVGERTLAANVCGGNLVTGRWDDVERVAAELPGEGVVATDPVHASVNMAIAIVALRRGDLERAISLVEPFTHWTTSARVQTEASGFSCRAIVALARGDFATASHECATGLRDERIGTVRAYAEELVEQGGEAAWRGRSADDLAEILELADRMSGGHRTLPGEARWSLLRARLAVLTGGEPDFSRAEELHRALADPYWLATTQLDHAEWLVGQGLSEEAGPLLREAQASFETLRARPSLERLTAIEATAQGSVVPG